MPPVATLILVLVVLLAFLPPATRPADLEARLAATDAKAQAIGDLTATFVQEKRSPMLRDPLVTRGTVRALPSAMRWDTDAGGGMGRTVMAVDADELRVWFVEEGVVEAYPVRGNVAALTASPLPRLSALREAFDVAPDDGAGLGGLGDGGGEPLALRLTPIDPDLAENVERVRVLLDAGRGVVRTFEVTDADGEVTVVRFGDVETDVGLAPADVRLDLPPGVRIVRPLGPVGGGD